MTGTSLAWAVVGMAAGGAHAAALWRAAHRIPAGYGVGLRLLVVFGVLVGAARVGVLLPFAAGWTSGLVVTSVLYVGAERWRV